MTGNLEMLMSLRNAKLLKDANVQVAEDIGKKAELGYFDVEFTMYGCAYLERTTDMMKYRISSKAEDIYDYVEKAAREDIYPSKVETLTLKCLVPIGSKALIMQDVKKELAKALSKKYTKDFFVALYDAADKIQSNNAAKMLYREIAEIEGQFEEEALSRLEALIHYMYGCKRIIREEYEKMLRWIAEERESMDENFVSKDIFEKTLYGVVYVADGELKYFSNAQRDHVYKKAYALESQGVFVSPIFAKTYWYNYSYRLSDVIKDYKNELRRVCQQTYIEKIERVKDETAPDQKAAFVHALEDITLKYGSDAAETMRRYGFRWCVL